MARLSDPALARPAAARAPRAPTRLSELAAPPRVEAAPRAPAPWKGVVSRQTASALGLVAIAVAAALAAALATWSANDPSFSHATDRPAQNALGVPGAAIADLVMQLFGLASIVALFPVVAWGWQMLNAQAPARPRVGAGVLALLAATLALACLPNPAGWPLPVGIGGAIGDTLLAAPTTLLGKGEWVRGVIGVMAGAVGLWFLWKAVTGGPAPVMETDDADEMDEPAPRRAIRVGQGLEPAERSRPTRAVADDFDDEDSEGRFAAVVGLVQHWGLTARARLGRLVGGGRGPRLREGFGDGFKGKLGRVLSPMEDEADYDAPPARRVEPQVAPRVSPDRAVAPQPRVADPRMAEPRVADPSAGEPRVARSPSAAPARAPDYDDAYADDQPELDADDVEALDEADDPPFDPAPIQRPTRGPAATVGLSQRPAAPAPARPAAPAPKVSQVPEDERRVAVTPPAKPMAPSPRVIKEAQARLPLLRDDGFQLPPLTLLAEPKRLGVNEALTPEVLEQNARDLEGVLEDFGVKGEIINVRPGPVVTLYELEPAPGIKSSRVIGLADDIARSMSAISARVAVIPGKNAIGIELPNHKRETVYLRELVGSKDFDQSKQKLALALGKTIGGEAVIVDLARTPHMLVAGTTGSGKSVSINTMILSLVYRLTPEQCKLIMIDPKMLELSVYDGIPHLLSPVVTDPKKAVVALKWTVREMEDRYRKMSKLGVRNIDGFNARVIEAKEQGEGLNRLIQTGFDRHTGEPIYEEEELSLEPLPYIVVIIDEMADLMMVAGKEIEGAVQRLAQMARAAGIHVIMATQRPSVDVITGTIKANFPTRISFQVTSKIDSRTILGEQGAEQLLGQGDMLYMAGGGRIQRVHGPFVSDGEVEKIVAHLKTQGAPEYLDAITRDEEEGDADGPGGNPGSGGMSGLDNLEESGDLYDQAVAVVLRDGKASTSYVQRRLQIGYNRAASLIERMEKEGIVGAANHAGKREILVPRGPDAEMD